jgi:hypothetical protein
VDILERVGQLVADLVSHHPRDANPTRLCKRFQTCRNIDAVAKDIVLVDDDITKIDPDPGPARILYCARKGDRPRPPSRIRC